MKTCTKCLQLLPETTFKKYSTVCRKCFYKHYTKPYRLKNPTGLAEERKRYRDKRKHDPIYKAQRNVRKRLKKQLDKGFKIGQTSVMLGCSLIEFKAYIEAQFYADMTWDNYGSYWHIDHIKPVCSFDLTDEEQTRAACHYSNLRPLWAEDNIKKAKYDKKQRYVSDEIKSSL